jgi:outer membrane lipoprotein-sorting protein
MTMSDHGHFKHAAPMIVAAVFILVGLPGRAAPQVPSDPAEILRRIDANLQIESAWTRARLIIDYRAGDVRTMEFESWSQGRQKAFLEFTAPARDAGSRFLRLEGVMWYYLPRVGKSVRIQGHMLRQGLMGSDFSLGDATENTSLYGDYAATVEADTMLEGRPVRVLLLQGERDDLAYPSRRIWVDTERWLPLREERYARSGRLLKTMTLSDVRRHGNRWYPFRIEMDDALQTDTRTIMETVELKIDIAVPERYFTLRYLEGGGR